MSPRRSYHTLLGSAAAALGAGAAVMLVSGGWQSVAAALAIFAGLVFVASAIGLGIASERPQPAGPAWAREGERAPRGHPAPARSAERASAAQRPARGPGHRRAHPPSGGRERSVPGPTTAASPS